MLAGEVWVNEAECRALAQHLGLGLDEFLSGYTVPSSQRPGWQVLRRAEVRAHVCQQLGVSLAFRCRLLWRVRPARN